MTAIPRTAIPRTAIAAGGLALLVSACDSADLPEEASQGPNPTIPEPSQAVVPTVNVAEGTGWKKGEQPVPASGLAVKAFAQGLDHPRWLYVLPNGDVLVAETNGPERPEDEDGIKGWIMGLAMSHAGAGVPSPDKIVLLRDSDGDGVAETKKDFLTDLYSPFGMALIGDHLYVANTDAVLRFPYEGGETEITAKGEKLAGLPGGPLNHHWTKSLVASPDGTKLYAGVGSNSNVAENGLDKEKGRAAIQEIDVATGDTRVYASGLRNPVGLAFNPASGALWAVVNERDELGSDLVPDYLTSVKEGGFYGWPFSYWGQHVDDRVEPQKPDLVKQAIVPDYALGNHVAPLGLTFAEGATLPATYQSGAFVGEHGSWNRAPRAGYKVVFVPFSGGTPSGKLVDVLTGFLNEDGEARGRPVGVAIDSQGGLLVVDDVGNTVWRVTASSQTARLGAEH
ncbi:sorbosone dehydrogenase [Methyloceanibacter superfactus]|uniref:Sorbosone dehydrogenase n=1 Tax=Methyloceanibacter superfactus TaxID=1774969 RepID=A0A1E3VR99_9HYPH|nr:sorbosone dehydrogenase family protein [Methyloceanibacter superfactus]ODR96050.1 sorbosone dehydrogenase [Methyloceanibacter superfactus]